MNNIDLTPILLAVIELAGVIALRYFIPWLRARTTEAQREDLLTWVELAVTAVQQLYWKEDGQHRLQRALDMLEEMGVDVDDVSVRAAIEAEVLKLHAGLAAAGDAEKAGWTKEEKEPETPAVPAGTEELPGVIIADIPPAPLPSLESSAEKDPGDIVYSETTNDGRQITIDSSGITIDAADLGNAVELASTPEDDLRDIYADMQAEMKPQDGETSADARERVLGENGIDILGMIRGAVTTNEEKYWAENDTARMEHIIKDMYDLGLDVDNPVIRQAAEEEDADIHAETIRKAGAGNGQDECPAEAPAEEAPVEAPKKKRRKRKNRDYQSNAQPDCPEDGSGSVPV